jgi:hypothetical protein
VHTPVRTRGFMCWASVRQSVCASAWKRWRSECLDHDHVLRHGRFYWVFSRVAWMAWLPG